MNNRPVASLSPTLLARKGGARPAMRPQLQPLRFQDNTALQLDDLGWNDMGHEADGQDEASAAELPVAPQAEMPQTAEIVALNPGGEQALAGVPEVVHQQEKIAHRLAKPKSAPRRSAVSQGRKAAFTLRLDEERHLKLRLACVTSGRSAQQLVTEALDRLITELPQVGELAVKVSKGR
ncbi:hypothetical protein KRR38_13355 [Novosphingobium sp. G106]|uniref:hypothetical protein n=1 Tax=Novosphingobium sp. G106 TaxID=2849500 RepID=UPI001C2D12B4|nr:hypothetical protein [Novosphingobium sp. G106]MBV1688634.1 hypothetical protein [Novosphingobium sp. G106]